MATNRTPFLEWGVAVKAAPGQNVCGDLHVVRPFADGVLVAVLDGLGHGGEAAKAARRGVTVLTGDRHQSLITLIQRCHQRLADTRGAVVTLAQFDVTDGTMTWVGVGNVMGVLLRQDRGATPQAERLLVRPGIVGVELPPLQAGVVQVATGDVLALVTDGIRPEFIDQVSLTGDPQEQADAIMRTFATEQDDALAFVARYRGREVTP